MRLPRFSALALVTARLLLESGCSPAPGVAAAPDQPASLPIDRLAPAPVGFCPGVGEPGDPVGLARCRLARALGAAGVVADIAVLTVADPLAAAVLDRAGLDVDARPESFVVVTEDATTTVIGSDGVGALYGAQSLAERIKDTGAAAFPVSPPLTGAPALPIRAANPFLLLPQPDEARWYFLDRDFWRDYLDLLLAARINFLDLHGMYDLDSTIFPNALLYFATSSSFPEVGLPAPLRQQNVDALNDVVAMAAARGIHVGLMSYRADSSLSGAGDSLLTSDADLKTYTREAAEDLARRVPGLWRLGFRIGESERPASWYEETFVAGVRAAGTGVRVTTRTWGASKPDILGVAAAAGDDTIVEAKFNGEHLGAPYAIQGGVFAAAGSYSYQSFLTPPVPYQFVFQLRAGGTHRIFRYSSYRRTQRTVKALALSPLVRGFSFEPPHAYFPARDYYHANRNDRFSEWTWRRDELAYLLFGRLGYDPSTPESFFRAALAARVGGDGLWTAVQAAGDIVPLMQTAHTCGIDSRDAAPELELAGDVGYWASPSATVDAGSGCAAHQTMDTFAVALPDEAADDLVNGRPTTRLSPLEIARLLMNDAADARLATAATRNAPVPPERLDVVRECQALADLGLYFGHKLRAATALGVYRRTGRADYLDGVRRETAASNDARRRLAADTRHIAPFADHLRMAQLGLPTFHWSKQLDRLSEDGAAIDAAVQTLAATPPEAPVPALPDASSWLEQARAAGPGLRDLSIEPLDPAASAWTVTAHPGVALAPDARVRILWKAFDSSNDWQAVEAVPTGDGGFAATIAGGGQGGQFAAEIVSDGGGWRYPDAIEETPYVVLPP